MRFSVIPESNGTQEKIATETKKQEKLAMENSKQEVNQSRTESIKLESEKFGEVKNREAHRVPDEDLKRSESPGYAKKEISINFPNGTVLAKEMLSNPNECRSNYGTLINPQVKWPKFGPKKAKNCTNKNKPRLRVAVACVLCNIAKTSCRGGSLLIISIVRTTMRALC